MCLIFYEYGIINSLTEYGLKRLKNAWPLICWGERTEIAAVQTTKLDLMKRKTKAERGGDESYEQDEASWGSLILIYNYHISFVLLSPWTKQINHPAVFQSLNSSYCQSNFIWLHNQRTIFIVPKSYSSSDHNLCEKVNLLLEGLSTQKCPNIHQENFRIFSP